MVPKSPYVVLVNDLPTHRRFVVTPERVSEWLKGHPMRDALSAPDPDPQAGHGAAELDLFYEGTHVYATGDFKGEVTVACSRCVGPAKLPIEEKLRVTFLPVNEMPAAEDDDSEDGAEVTGDDLDVFAYDGEKVDLEPLLREQFVLAVPFAPVCREDCKGLCPHCGTDRNTGTCACEAPIDPRLAGLKGLKIPS